MKGRIIEKERKHITDTKRCCSILVLILAVYVQIASGSQANEWITFTPEDGQIRGNIVLISGDEEYRSEEALPMLAKILTKHHGYETTVLFSIDPETGEIDPDNQTNIPGLHHLESADLMVIFTRFRELPDEDMRYIDEYFNNGKPIVGMRTATHAFSYERNLNSPYAKYSFNSDKKGWEGGFGRQILGETWIAHHGIHGEEGTRGLLNGILEQENHPILNGVSDIWGNTDVYEVRALKGNPDILVWGQPSNGMTSDSSVNWSKSIMPVAWAKNYTSESGTTGRVFNTTMGGSQDLESEDLRRLLINACYWAMGFEEDIPEVSKVEYVGDYNPTMFGFGTFRKGLTPSDYE